MKCKACDQEIIITYPDSIENQIARANGYCDSYCQLVSEGEEKE
jgi:hypothetical protein